MYYIFQWPPPPRPSHWNDTSKKRKVDHDKNDSKEKRNEATAQQITLELCSESKTHDEPRDKREPDVEEQSRRGASKKDKKSSTSKKSHRKKSKSGKKKKKKGKDKKSRKSSRESSDRDSDSRADSDEGTPPPPLVPSPNLSQNVYRFAFMMWTLYCELKVNGSQMRNSLYLLV